MTSMASQLLGSILPQAKDWIGGSDDIKGGEGEFSQTKTDPNFDKSTPTTHNTNSSYSSSPSAMPTVIKKYKAAAVQAEPGVGILS